MHAQKYRESRHNDHPAGADHIQNEAVKLHVKITGYLTINYIYHFSKMNSFFLAISTILQGSNPCNRGSIPAC